MCGVAGFIERSSLPRREANSKILQEMGDLLSSRGPDEQVIVNQKLALVFRRLAIVGRDSGQQPIWNADRSCMVAINGEIYNYRELRNQLSRDFDFKTDSDAESVLHLYEKIGTDCFSHLNGEFAIVIWDKRKDKLIFCRDRLGIKPFFYHLSSRGIYFASELKPLLSHPSVQAEFSWSDLQARFKRIPSFRQNSPRYPTFVDGIEQLPGGNFAEFNSDGQFSVRQYWNLENSFSPARETSIQKAETWADQYLEIFLESVKLRVDTDLDVSAFLSGGIDSSLMVAASAVAGKPPICFSIAEENTIACGDLGAAAQIAEKYGLQFFPVDFKMADLARNTEMNLDKFERFVWQIEQPFFKTEWFLKDQLYIFIREKFPDMKVNLVGQGADEFSGGYSNVGFIMEMADSWAQYESGTSCARTLNLTLEKNLFVPKEVAGLVSDSYRRKLLPEYGSRYRTEMIERVMWMQTYNHWHEDRTSAGHGFEARVPFLDHRLVEFLASVPTSLYPELFWDKKIVREAASRLVPRDLCYRRKVGLINGGKDINLVRFLYRVMLRVYPKFREKYLLEPDAVFDLTKMDQLFEVAKAGQGGVDRLLTCITITIIKHGIETRTFPKRAQARSPLRVLDFKREAGSNVNLNP